MDIALKNWQDLPVLSSAEELKVYENEKLKKRKNQW